MQEKSPIFVKKLDFKSKNEDWSFLNWSLVIGHIFNDANDEMMK